MSEPHEFHKGDRVQHIPTGKRGTVIYVGPHMLGVVWNDTRIALPVQAEHLRKLKEET
jgi:hypothetical protein